MTDLLLIGAGLGALACAGDVALSPPPTLLDKGRRLAGRAATRQMGGATLDHGARFFTARTPRLRQWAEEGVHSGWLWVWSHGFPQWQADQIDSGVDGHPRYIPLGGMRELGHQLAQGAKVHSEVRVSALRRVAGHWEAAADDGQLWQAKRVVLNLPAPQAAALLTGCAPHLAAELRKITYHPCWTVGVTLERDLCAQWPALHTVHPVLDWIAREHTKRPGTPPALILQANADWSNRHLEAAPDEVTARLLQAAAEIVGEEIAVLRAFAHRWRYAQPVTRYPAAYLWDDTLGLGACGDGFMPDAHPSRVEAALLSGWALAEALRGERASP